MSNRRPCPAGTYGPLAYQRSLSGCAPCPPGQYCSGPLNGYGRSAPDGPCAAGYACHRGTGIGASSATPTSSAPGGVATASESGLCPPGFYCPVGATYPVPCPPGSYQSQAGATSCLPCEAGKFCAVPGTSAAAAQLPACADGFFCIRGANNSMPSDGQTGRLCAVAHACTGGLERPCPEGTYGPGEGLTACPVCPAGFFCGAAVSAPTPCPTGRFCAAGSTASTRGAPCPPGTFTGAEVYGLEAASQCTPCPPGKYCLGGATQASGLCPAGLLCTSGAGAEIAALADLSCLTTGSCELRENRCPAGYFCVTGTVIPQPCPDGTYSGPGSKSDADCSACEAGYYCRNGTREELLCPAGQYCPPGVSDPTPCPKQTYGPKEGADSLADCQPCPPGYLCDEAGIADLANYACPAGYYCPKGTLETFACPVSTFRPMPGGSSEASCFPCTPGFFCPQLGTVTPLLCGNGTYCQRGSSAPTVCPPGAFCPAGSDSPTPCPAGFFCSGGSEYFAKCVNGTFCPAGSAFPVPCPGGTFGSGNPENVDEASGCSPCGRGSYSTDSDTKVCRDCPAGYVCLGRTNSAAPKSRLLDNGY
jgi:hypothetical protein